MALRNHDLYDRLCKIYDKKNVNIHDPGVATEFARRSLGGDTMEYRFENIGMSRGEQFSFSCPFCSDERKRCYMHHLYATPENDFEYGYIRLWRCFNEECQADFNNRKEMLRLITAGGTSDKFLIDHRVNVKPLIEKPSWPGTMRSLKRLLEEEPEHRAIQWCLARNIDVKLLIRNDVRYCELGDGRHPHITDRLVVPFMERNLTTKKIELAGWTARLLKQRNPLDAKWVHSRTPTKRKVIGLNGCSDSIVSVFVEGPGDRWATGPCSAALLGKFITQEKAKIIAAAFRRKPMKDRVALVMLDPDQSEDSLKKGEEHHIEKSVKILQKETDCPVLPVYLPPTTDPGELFNCYLMDTMLQVLITAGYQRTAEKFYEQQFNNTNRS